MYRSNFTMVDLVAGAICVGMIFTLFSTGGCGGRRTGPQSRVGGCQNQLRQLGLACQSYSGAGGLPVGIDSETRHTGLTALLPFLDAGIVFDKFGDFSGKAESYPRAVAIHIPIFHCLGDTADGGMWNNGTADFAHSNYVLCFGSDTLRPHWNLAKGIFRLDRPSNFSTASVDGAANTALMSEVVAGTKGDSAGCWAYGDAGSSAYTHREPPNSGRHVTFDETGKWEEAYGIASSNHPGGVNVLFGDMHTQFISDDVDPEVWKALGSASGGEKIEGQF